MSKKINGEEISNKEMAKTIFRIQNALKGLRDIDLENMAILVENLSGIVKEDYRLLSK